MPVIMPIRTGWDPLPTEPGFYPDDLPEDWRLAYAANALRGLLLEPVLWRAADVPCLSQWASDVPASFRFYLALDATEICVPGLTGSELIRARNLLGERFGGWVGVADPVQGYGQSDTWYVEVASIGAAAASPADRLACAVPESLAADLRGARAWLEGLAGAARGRPTLALMGQARFADVTRWQILAELLGLG